MQKKDMELEGTLRAFSLPDILQFLSMGKMTGILSIWRDAYNISLTIKDGRIVNSSVLDRMRKLGEMLVYRGLIKRRDLQEVLRAQMGLDRGKLLGQILVERELISKNTLRDALKLQLQEEIWELFFWQDGQFKFEQRGDIDVSNLVVEIDIEPLMMEGSRRQDEWTKISQNLTDDSIVLTCVKQENPMENEVTLSRDEWIVLGLVNGFYEVGSIVDRSGLGKFETYRILNSFLTAGLIISKPQRKIEEEFFSTPPGGETGVATLKSLKTADSPVAETLFGAAQSKKGLSSLFSRPKPTIKETPQSSIQLDFVSPLGAAAFFVNSFYESLMATEGFVRSPEDDNIMLAFNWRNLLMRHPRADLVRITNGRINAKPLENIIQIQEGISKIISECYDETLVTLNELIALLHQIALERLGDKTLSRIANSALNEFGANIRYKHDERFDFRTWVQDLIKI
ncbi:MAG TPA: DUF4388 domain-containing protein [Candidatus Sumerlaeota bacterium]|nr:MAG: hypothetical protein BWY12_02186 [candidate division BRC1 bacterium ADurb.Bin183]HOE62879.1 DUF4388 domain-containing protein [Candidatus Sumerlaeota bacterium]HRR29792.1 DUF4388 domain-containing protein [Candidatus Sumerlaeia bacterium]HON50229.1 DUF4388 domain-containing protein [Candidatus Sumerlaeota bacterium]HOR63445.1 DUF4388 domain-containing protein [Candidatus Sumerlaeota bacterium]